MFDAHLYLLYAVLFLVSVYVLTRTRLVQAVATALSLCGYVVLAYVLSSVFYQLCIAYLQFREDTGMNAGMRALNEAAENYFRELTGKAHVA